MRHLKRLPYFALAALAVTVLSSACSSSDSNQTTDAAEPTSPVEPSEPTDPPTPTDPTAPPSPSAPAPLEVTTESGDVRGTTTDGVRSFLGIPYAAPPVGDLRWRAPAPTEPWDGVREANVAGAPCPQTIPIVNAPTGSEDCLYLNVVTPDPLPSGPAPVMVWIHGGGFTSGDGRQYTGSTDGSTIAAKSGTIVVTLNYRLGQLGFLAHHALTNEDPSHPSSGNYGIEDQVAALEWVERNILAFGGDPENVTIFGESAGAWSVCALLTSPLSGGLFHRGIMQSGPCTTRLATLQNAERQGERFAEVVGCAGALDVLECLREAPRESVMAALPPDPAFVFSEGEWGSWFPIIDDYVLTENMAESFASGSFHRVPLLVGSNDDEGTLFVALSHDHAGRPLQASQYRERLSFLISDDEEVIDSIEERYPVDAFASPGLALAASFGDAALACPSIETARLAAPHTPTYLYQFTFTGGTFPIALNTDIDLGAYHAAEIPYVFGTPSVETPFTEVEQTLSDAMIGYWTRFAATGDPNGGDARQWPRLGDDARHLSAGTAITPGTNARGGACTFWRGVALREPLLPLE